jgi:hypothetical protein
MTTSPARHRGPGTAEDVANLDELRTAANTRLTARVDARSAVRHVTGGRREALATQVRPADQDRADRASGDHEVLLAETAVRARRQIQYATTSRAPARCLSRS